MSSLRMFLVALPLASALGCAVAACSSGASSAPTDAPAGSDSSARASTAPPDETTSRPSPSPPSADAGPRPMSDAAADAGNDGATPAPSTFDVTVDGFARTVTFTRAVLQPIEQRIGVHAHVSALSQYPEGDFLLFVPADASGDIGCDTGSMVFQTASGDQLVLVDDDTCTFTNVSIGAVGGVVSGTVSGTLQKTLNGVATMRVNVNFAVMREADSEFL